MALQSGVTILNKYRVVKLLGEGGMARVWLAEELTFGKRLVALKEPRPNPLSDDAAEIALRYQREVQVCAELEQAGVPQIVRAITAEPYEEGLLLVMAYMPGGDLASLIKQHPHGLPPERAVAIALDVLAALDGAHSHPLEIIHRDVKPSNILFDKEGRAYLADFGLAQLAGVSGRSQLRGGQHPGTPPYMAPEQERTTGYLSPAADLFALGCVLWEMLTGQRYKRSKPGTPASQLRADVPVWLDQVVMKALAEDAWERWQGAGEMAGALRAGAAAARSAKTERPPRTQPQAPKQPSAQAASTAPIAAAPTSSNNGTGRHRPARLGWLAGAVALMAVAAVLFWALSGGIGASGAATATPPATAPVVAEITDTPTHAPPPASPAAPTNTPTSVAAAVETVAVVRDVVAEDLTNPHPILSDLRVRRAIAHCLDRNSMFASVYPYIDDTTSFLMDSFLPKNHWAYGGPYSDFPLYDPGKAKELLDQAGWTLPQGSTIRTNVQGEPLAIKFTTTTAQFRQTWSAVMKQNLEDCGFQILTNYVPASWWYGDTTGLARRDFELGAFAWIAQADPYGRTLYACDQILLSSNNWEGQNYMGWCNPTASAAIVKANNTLIRNERITAYDIVQEEFAKDVVSIPIFQRAEVEAWRSNLQGVSPDPTEYATANLQEWRLADGGDTIVLGMTQEPDSMWSLVSTMPTQPLLDRPAKGAIYSQYDYDYQPALQYALSTIESGLATNDVVEVEAGDTVYDAGGKPVRLEKGVKITDSEGTVVEYSGSGMVRMRRLVVTYRLRDYTWSDGVAGSVDDMKLGFRIDCDQTSGGKIDSFTCDAIDSKSFASSANEVIVTYSPGYQNQRYFVYPFNIYPSHQILRDGRKLESVPATEWAALPEIAETPLSFGPYFVTEWVKGQSITLAPNPYWWGGKVTIPNVIYVFLADTNQAVAMLVNGDVDYLDDSTLGAGSEVQTVIDAAEATGNVKYRISAGPTWEHIDINLSTE